MEYGSGININHGSGTYLALTSDSLEHFFLTGTLIILRTTSAVHMETTRSKPTAPRNAQEAEETSINPRLESLMF